MYLIVFVLLQCTAVICSEPSCSRFHYEEKLLEKMVRLEFQVEQMKEERQQLRDALANMRTEVREQKSRLDQYQGGLFEQENKEKSFINFFFIETDFKTK